MVLILVLVVGTVTTQIFQGDWGTNVLSVRDTALPNKET
jgi:hypothetical protein